MEMGGGRRVGGWVGGSVGEGRRDAVRERRVLQRGGRREQRKGERGRAAATPPHPRILQIHCGYLMCKYLGYRYLDV
jgi:hypothetical protein